MKCIELLLLITIKHQAELIQDHISITKYDKNKLLKNVALLKKRVEKAEYYIKKELE